MGSRRGVTMRLPREDHTFEEVDTSEWTPFMPVGGGDDDEILDLETPGAADPKRKTRRAPKTDQEEEAVGEWAQDLTDANEGASTSRLARNTAEENLEWLARPPMTRGDALRRMSPLERGIFAFLVVLRPLLLLSRIWSLPQKSEPWKWARNGRITGSSTGAAVGQQRNTRVQKAAYGSVYLKFKGSVATEWGSGKEVYGTRCHANDWKRLVVKTFREQRRSGEIQRTADAQGRLHFVFRNQRIPVPHIDHDPHVEVRHYGLMIDPWNHWRGVSPDGVLFINDIACGALEVKCSFGKKYSLYTNVRPYYYNQLQCEMYIVNRYWPTVRWLDFVVWSPEHFTVDTYTFDAEYFYGWYAPREIKYYFQLYLPTLAERVHFIAQRDSGRRLPSADDLEGAMRRLFIMPGASTAPVKEHVTISKRARWADSPRLNTPSQCPAALPLPSPVTSLPARMPQASSLYIDDDLDNALAVLELPPRK